MTFMMEPPRFVPIPMESSNEDRRGGTKLEAKYKLFMYSEYGFPYEADLRRDFKDSMPVLFVPGNAGSYQQVRSLASTCIRRQLGSLDAFKFIFYTIDFQGQYSGISGQLVEEQINFVHQAVIRINTIHSDHTDGVIVIGHSVGGFILKALLTKPDFNPSLVPLLISLASPLTRPYLNFDDVMKRIYDHTNDYWANSADKIETVSISISGGRSDRLVPVHSSLDPNYDICITTNSISEVWLSTDHVCITWCRELMHKLAGLLSKVMDKRDTKLISNKTMLVEKIVGDLTTRYDLGGTSAVQLHDSTKIIKPRSVLEFSEFYTFSRQQLGDETIVLNLTSRDQAGVFIWLEHVQDLKRSGLFGCSKFTVDDKNSHASCEGRINLFDLVQQVPSARYEPKKKVMYASYKDVPELNYLVIDFNSNLRNDNHNKDRVPEIIIVQIMNLSSEKTLYLPTMIEYYYNRMINPELNHWTLTSDKDFLLATLSYRITNLNQETQFFKALLSSSNCSHSEAGPREATVLLTQASYVKDIFRPLKGKRSVIVDLNPLESFKAKSRPQVMGSEMSLIFFLDGTCKNTIDLEFDWVSLIEAFMQKYLGEILTLCCYISWTSIIMNSLKLQSSTLQSTNPFKGVIFGPLWVITGICICHEAKIPSNLSAIAWSIDTDFTIRFIILFIISYALSTIIEYIIAQVINLALIIHNVTSFIDEAIRKTPPGVADLNHREKNGSVNGTKEKHSTELPSRFASFSLDWFLLCLAIPCSLFLSEIIMSICILIILIKTKLYLNVLSRKEKNISENTKKTVPQQKGIEEKLIKISKLQSLVSSAIQLSALGFAANIQPALLALNCNYPYHNVIPHLVEKFTEYNFVATLLSTVTVQYCSKLIESTLESGKGASSNTLFPMLSAINNLPTNIVALAVMIRIKNNLQEVNIVQLVTFMWLTAKFIKLDNDRRQRPYTSI